MPRSTCPGIVLLCLLAAPALGADWLAGPPVGTSPRTWGAGVLAPDGRIFVVGGEPWNGGGRDGSVHLLPRGGSAWSAQASLDGPKVGQGAGFDTLGRLIVYTGMDLIDGDLGAARPYDPVEGYTGDIAQRNENWPHAYCALAVDSDSRLYSIGGNNGEGGSNSSHADRYDATLDAWQTLPPMPTPAGDAAGVYDGRGHVLVIGGLNAAGNARLANVARFDIATNAWSDTAVADLPVATSGLRAVLGSDDRVYALGGETGPIGSGVTTNTVWVLDQDSNTWTAGPSMLTPRKHFATLLETGATRIWAIGGENDSGGTNATETLYTPVCPRITSQPALIPGWRGIVARLSIDATGGSPLTFQWRRDGTPLSDGPTGWGSTIQGATTSSLQILAPDDADLGLYDVAVSNPCGTEVSIGVDLSLRDPPGPGARWETRTLHPDLADGASSATGVSEGRIVGSASMTTTLPDGRVMVLSHPFLWEAPDFAAVDLTPAGSVGGGLNDVRGDYLVGWFWHTWQCWSGGQYWTCAWQSAGFWSAATRVFTETHTSGAEYDALSATDGVRMVGTSTHEYSEGNYISFARLHSPPNFWGDSLHPASASQSFANAIDGDRQYGSVFTPYPGPVSHAAMWRDTPASFSDIHPAGYSRSWVTAARDGQVVGTAWVGDSAHAILWSADGSSFVDFGQSSFADTCQGVQVGSAGGVPTLWFGTPDSKVSLPVPTGFTSATPNAVELAPDGVIWVAGSGFNQAAARSEAILWRSTHACPADFNADGTVDFFDYLDFAAAFDAETQGADFNADGSIDFFDYLDFVQAFAEGC